MSPSPLLDYVLAKLDARKGQWPQIAEASGVPYRTIEKIGKRKVYDPHVRKIEVLAAFFRKLGNRKQIPNGHDRAGA